jgi:hypothetical protein
MSEAEINAERARIAALKLAVGPVGRLMLTPGEYGEVVHALGWFIGGSPDSVVFLADPPPEAGASAHHVYWLRGQTIGSFVIGAHKGAMGEYEMPSVNGYVRPISAIERLELQGIEFQAWHQGAFVDPVPDVRPTVVIHFVDGDPIIVNIAAWTNESGRKQAFAFIDSLQAALATA